MRGGFKGSYRDVVCLRTEVSPTLGQDHTVETKSHSFLCDGECVPSPRLPKEQHPRQHESTMTG